MTETVPYLKMNGLGNDFVIVDARVSGRRFTSEEVRRISDRGTGIGCDQMIIMEPAKTPGADVFMRIYNQNGGEVDACGNAARCVAALAGEELGRTAITIESNAGLLFATIARDCVTVDMGVPRFDWKDIPLSEEFADTKGIELQIGPIDAPVLHTPSVVNVGNPHAVFWAGGDPEDYELERNGPLLENHPLFPEGANISVARILDDDRIRVKVWERGVGLTRACGTAACAVAVAAARLGKCGRKVTIELPGGALELHWRKSDGHIEMSGPWSLDGRGTIPKMLLAEPVAAEPVAAEPVE